MSVTSQLAARISRHVGYVEGAVDEASDLTGACDVVLTRSDGQRFSVFCLVDAEKDEAKRFGLERVRVKEILALCRDRYCGTLTGAKEPAVLEIVEVRALVKPEDLTRLRAYPNRFIDVDAVHAYALDCALVKALTATKVVVLGRRRFLEREMRKVLSGTEP